MATDTRKPVGALDSDIEDRLLPADHYRYALNGRSGTSDRDGTGSTEGIRGNTLIAIGVEGEKVIGSCPDIKNNAVIRFVQNNKDSIPIAFFSAAISTIAPTVTLTISGIGVISIPLGSFVSVVEAGPNTFVGQVTAIVGNVYTLFVVHGTPTVAAVTTITKTFYNYIRRNYVAGGQQFLINPVLMSSVLGWSASTRIYNPRIIEAGFTQLLAWTDPTPRILDVDKMKQG